MAKDSDFLYPRHRYYGQFKPEYLVFNSNLQEFSQRVSYICNLQTAGKLSPEDAYTQIKMLWKQLRDFQIEKSPNFMVGYGLPS